MTSFNLNYLCKSAVSKYSHAWGYGFYKWILGRQNSIYDILPSAPPPNSFSHIENHKSMSFLHINHRSSRHCYPMKCLIFLDKRIPWSIRFEKLWISISFGGIHNVLYFIKGSINFFCNTENFTWFNSILPQLNLSRFTYYLTEYLVTTKMTLVFSWTLRKKDILQFLIKLQCLIYRLVTEKDHWIFWSA